MTIQIEYCNTCCMETEHEWRYDKDQEGDEMAEKFELICLKCENKS